MGRHARNQLEEASRRMRTGRLLREARERRGLTLGAVCAEVGVSIPYLSEVERGVKPISADNLERLVDLLGLDEAARQRVFRGAACLPPSVLRRTLAAPDAWRYDPARLLQAAQVVNDFLRGGTSRVAAQKAVSDALKPHKW